jgi:molybdenum cofactor cytidylyltransferase
MLDHPLPEHPLPDRPIPDRPIPAQHSLDHSGCACVILGAGAGTRFGEPKAGALLPDGVRFVDAIASRLRDAGVRHLVAVLHPDVAPPEGARPVVNRKSAGEQIESLKLGLAQLVNTPVTGTLVWPVDHPLVSLMSIREILDEVVRNNPLLAIPGYRGKHGHPAYFARDLWRELATVQSGGARTVVHQHAAECLLVEVDDVGVIRNIDTKEDLSDAADVSKL